MFSGSIFNGGPPPRAPAPPQQAVSANDPWQVGAPANMAQIKDLQVQCEKDMMRVRVIFDRPFYGMIFSKGFYSDPNCVHLAAGSGTITASFEIFLNSCGMTSSGNTETYGQVGYSAVAACAFIKQSSNNDTNDRGLIKGVTGKFVMIEFDRRKDIQKLAENLFKIIGY